MALKRYIVTGTYQDVVYAESEEQAVEQFRELNAICEREEGEFDTIKVEYTPINYEIE